MSGKQSWTKTKVLHYYINPWLWIQTVLFIIDTMTSHSVNLPNIQSLSHLVSSPLKLLLAFFLSTGRVVDTEFPCED